ncbi:uncharacterized protein LOC128670384 isoform X2 [Plodia interpunctella]|nr:uncharacterized protein LOC128670384 isoform X2 [Plodia interpunctella]
MISGCLLVTGAAVASLSLVISIYMRPEEAFRARYRLIIKEMSETNVPASLRQKVESFYKMYWHKQRAVSDTVLLTRFPPTLPTLIYTDIYFEATQKTRILRDLNFAFLSELAKMMSTVNYIPGDAIINRNSTKSSIIFITYGDVEMLTAEDDNTPILRMTRGTVLSPCAGGVVAACARSHVMIRAASFCTAHVLDVDKLWRVALKYGKNNSQNEVMIEAFNLHLENVKKHYQMKFLDEAKYKSSILNFKNNLRRLKQVTDNDGKLILKDPELFLEIAKSYIMRNRTDSTTDESDAICLKSTFPCILQPDSSLQVAWQIVASCCTVAAAVVIPYNVVFKSTPSTEYDFFRTVVDTINIMDVIVHLSTGAHVEEGVPINFMQTSSQQMRSMWFFLDVAAILPIFYFVGDGLFDGVNKLLKLPKVFRNLKSLEDMFVNASTKMRLISFTILTLIACYLIATLQQGFMCFQFGHCLVTNFTHSPYWEEKPLDDENVLSRIIFGLYWAILMMTFTTHMEVFGLDHWDNVIYTVILLEICIVLHIFIEAVYSATIMVTTFLRDDYDATITNVKNFMIRNDVDPQMRKRFITYLELCWYTDKAYSMTNKKKSIFHDLPPHVYQEIVSRKRSKFILNIPFMKHLPRADLKTISSTARLFYTSPNEILMNTGDITNEMFVIKQGMCEVINPDNREVVALLGAKGHFGVVECLLRLPTYYTVRAVTHVQVFSISKKKLEKILEIPQIKYAVRFARTLPEYRNLQVRRESFLFFEPPRPPPNREKFRLPKKYEQDTAFLQPFNRLGFLAVLRYVFPRFTIRPDSTYLQRYEWFRGVCALMTAMLCTSYTYLVLQWPSLYYVLILLDMSAYYDIVQRLLVGYYNDLGILVYHPAATSAYYLKGAFAVDMLATIPLEFLETEQRFYSSRYNLYKLSPVRQMLMMNRLLQMYRLPNAINNLITYIQRRDIHLIIQALPFFLTLLNVLTCTMIFNSVDIYTTASATTWRIVPFADKGGSWVVLFERVFRFNITETPFNLHLATYFWMVYTTTTTGYSCFHPTNFGLMKVLFIGMVISTMVITYFSVSIISVRANVNKELAGFQEDLRDMIKFMRREDLDKNLQNEVLSYYEYNWDKMGGVDYNKVLKLCDQITLRTDAILHIYGPTFAKCPFLMRCDISLLRIVGREVRSVYLLRDMHIFDVDDVISDLYFLVYGQVQVRVFYDDRSTVAKLHRGSVFGNLDQVAMARSQSTVVALSRIHILQIKTFNFHRILADFPRVNRMMAKCRAANKNFIPNTGAQNTRNTKERLSVNASRLLRGRRGIIKHLYFKDQILQIYLIVVSLACVYLDVYNAGFQNNSVPLIIVLYLLDFLFYMKILIQFSLPYIVNTENLKKVITPLRRGYFRGDFRYDLMSCVPIELFSLANRKYRWMIFSWLRLNRLLRIVTVYKCLIRHQERLNINLTLTTVVGVVIWFSLFIHTSSCLWYFIAVMEDNRRPFSSWIYKNATSSWCRQYYICSMYSILTTFTQNGVGDILAKNHSEVIFISVFQIISAMVYMVYVGEFSNIIQYQSFRNFGFYCKYLELQHFLNNNRVSKNLVNAVNAYALHLWREARGVQVPNFLVSAPPAIKLKVMAAAYMAHLENHIVFEACEKAFLRQLVGKLKMYYYNREMFIVKEGEITDTMYIVHTGRVKETSSGSTTARTIIAGGSFGLVEGLYPGTPFKCSYKSVLKCQILSLPFSDWNYLLSYFPKSADSIYDHLDFDDNYGPFTRPIIKQEYRRKTSWEESENPPDGSTGGEVKPVVAPKSPSARRQSTPFAVPMKDTGALNLLASKEKPQVKSTSSDTPSEFELTNVSLTDQADKPIDQLPTTSARFSVDVKAKMLDKKPIKERADLQSVQTIKFDDSTDTTTTSNTDPSTANESVQGSMDLETKRKLIYSHMERNESFPEDVTTHIKPLVDTNQDEPRTKMDTVDTKIDTVDNKMEEVDTKMETFDTKMDTIGTKMDTVDDKMDNVDTKMGKMDEVDAKMDKDESKTYEVDAPKVVVIKDEVQNAPTVSDTIAGSDPEKETTKLTYVGPLNSRISIAPMPNRIFRIDSSSSDVSEKMEITPQKESSKTSNKDLSLKDKDKKFQSTIEFDKEVDIDKNKTKDKDKKLQSTMEFGLDNDDDIDQDEFPEKATSTTRYTRRLVHVRYEDDAKKKLNAATTSNPPETRDLAKDNLSIKSTSSSQYSLIRTKEQPSTALNELSTPPNEPSTSKKDTKKEKDKKS